MGSANIAGVSGSTYNLTRYGGNGLAFNTPTQVVAVNSSLVPFTWSAQPRVEPGRTARRWSGGAAPTLTDEIANFGSSITVASTISVTSPVSEGWIMFNNSNSYTVSGSAAITMQSSSGTAGLEEILGSHTISATLVLASSTAIIIGQPAASLTLAGPVSGTGALVCSGSGTAILANANSFTGGLTVTSGTVTLAHPLAVQDSTVTLSAGDFWLCRGQHLPNLRWSGRRDNVALATAASEPVTLKVGQNGQSTVYSRALSGPGKSLIKIGSGTLSLTGSSTYAVRDRHLRRRLATQWQCQASGIRRPAL